MVAPTILMSAPKLQNGSEIMGPYSRHQRGLTLTELAVAMAVAGILLAAGYGIFVAQQKTYAVQDQVVQIQQNARVAMNLVARDLRMAGHGRPDGPVAKRARTARNFGSALRK